MRRDGVRREAEHNSPTPRKKGRETEWRGVECSARRWWVLGRKSNLASVGLPLIGIFPHAGIELAIPHKLGGVGDLEPVCSQQ
ncbi:hypothetical protein GUJ93_ZPchr0006g42091 [Zizania palustris]|uniref:Uncharacterized protein n=1 Tax=Zizania palustris TaxID=103762 RepID=A0A8J5TCD8_ZIZPA|nr:hypothetical protein GUJ93_ZPchr0006g42091 [Zizania palustris]